MSIGGAHTYTANRFERNPFTYKQTIAAGYFLATNGFAFEYDGEFANVIGKTNLGIEAAFTSPNFASNFFGFGNESINLEPDNDNINKDFNRVKLRKLELGTSLNWNGELASVVKLSAIYQDVKVDRTPNRFYQSCHKPFRSCI